MDLQQAKILINKINSLFRGMEGSDQTLSAIERDLMLTYIRQLYEEFLNLRGDMPAAKTPTRSMEGESSKPAFEVIAPKPPVQTSKPKIIEVPESLKDIAPAPPPPKPKEIEKITPAPKPKVEPKIEPKIESRPVSSAPPEKQKEYNLLFEFKAAKELSEKLSERRVDDLSKALAINDRLLYMNELFGKDPDALNETLRVLNKYENLQEARGLLINLAERFDWLNEEKLPTAQGFIKLVRRKYI